MAVMTLRSAEARITYRTGACILAPVRSACAYNDESFPTFGAFEAQMALAIISALQSTDAEQELHIARSKLLFSPD